MEHILPQHRAMPEPRTAVNSLPDTIRIGFLTYTFTSVSAGKATANARYGMCSKVLQEIELDESMKPDRAVACVLHEIMHALWEVYNIKDSEEERIVTCFGYGMAQVHADNPWLADWIKEWSEAGKA